MLNILSFVLKLIMVYFIIGLLAMWLLETVIYKALIKHGTMTKSLSAYYEHLSSLPLMEKFLLYGLCWPGFMPGLISAAVRVLL